MKRLYDTPEVEIEKYTIQNVITTSGNSENVTDVGGEEGEF